MLRVVVIAIESERSSAGPRRLSRRMAIARREFIFAPAEEIRPSGSYLPN